MDRLLNNIFNSGLLEKCDKEENLEVTEANTNSCSKILENVVSNVMYSPIHHLASTRMVNIQSTLQTAPDLCKNVSVPVLLGSNGNSYTISTESSACIYTHTHSSQ
jgi:hypothetical protein